MDTHDAEVMIACEGVVSGYSPQKPLMTRIDLQIRRGERVFILGGSGCGKSTLFKHMIGQVPVLGGRIFIKGQEITAATGDALNAIRRTFGVMYQGGALFGNLTILQNVLLPLEEFTNYPPTLRMEIARLQLHRVRLLDQCDKMPSELSGGMRKRAAIARAMALDPEILFLDEPSAGLDPITSAELDRLIVQLSETLGITVVIISHELASIHAVGTHAIYLDKGVGGVLSQGTPHHLATDTTVPTVYNFFNRIP